MDEDLERIAIIRKRIFLTGLSASNAHLASAFSIVEILYSLYMKGVLNVDPNNPGKPDRDRLILSKGHGSLALYVALAMAGFIEEEQLKSFCKAGAELAGEPVLNQLPGIEASTGSLGHGLPLGVGMALALRSEYPNAQIYVILGDGECEEGSVWEAIISAAAYGLDNLTVILDNNRIQKMGFVHDIAAIDDWDARWKAFGWATDVVDGHDVGALTACLTARPTKGKPRVVVANTVKGKGVSLMEDNAAWHWRLPNRRELNVFKSELGITDEEIDACKKHI